MVAPGGETLERTACLAVPYIHNDVVEKERCSNAQLKSSLQAGGYRRAKQRKLNPASLDLSVLFLSEPFFHQNKTLP